MKTTMVRILACVALCTAATSVFACTGMYAGRKVSVDGTVLIGRTVDTPPWSCCFRAVRVPRGENVKYAYVCTPAVTSVRWLRRSLSTRWNRERTAPALGSSQP